MRATYLQRPTRKERVLVSILLGSLSAIGLLLGLTGVALVRNLGDLLWWMTLVALPTAFAVGYARRACAEVAGDQLTIVNPLGPPHRVRVDAVGSIRLSGGGNVLQICDRNARVILRCSAKSWRLDPAALAEFLDVPYERSSLSLWGIVWRVAVVVALIAMTLALPTARS